MTLPRLPPGYTALKELAEPSDCMARFDIAGVVISREEPRKTKNDWLLEFNIQDDFTSGQIGNRDSCIRCCVYDPDEKVLRSFHGVGSISLCRRISVYTFQDKLYAKSTQNSETLLLHHDKIPPPERVMNNVGHWFLGYTGNRAAQQLSQNERHYVVALKHHASNFLPSILARAQKPTKSFKRACIKDLEDSKYYDILAEVTKIWDAGFEAADLVVTDYTCNKRFCADQNDFELNQQGKPEPEGQMTFQIRLWSPHAGYALSCLKPGSIVFLQNVFTKTAYGGQFNMDNPYRLEGSIHTDRRYPNKICLREVKHKNQLDEIAHLKDEYKKACAVGGKVATNVQEDGDIARKYSEDHGWKSQDSNTPKKPSATKKELKKERERLKMKSKHRELERKAEEDSGTNPHIRAAYPEYPLCTISEINESPLRKIGDEKGQRWELPFINAKYRSRIRVVDFWPRDVRAFSVKRSVVTQYNSDEGNIGDTGSHLDDYYWNFTLLVQDANASAGAEAPKLCVQVDNVAAQYLLKMNAVKLLGANDDVLRQLKEKLFILWGNLLELHEQGAQLPLHVKDSRLQSKPFDCYLEEYGVMPFIENVAGSGSPPFVRLYKMFMTTIMV